MQVTVVSTVFNEGASIGQFVESLLNQSRKPDAIIIADGGSKDDTLARLRKLEKKHPLLTVLVAPGNIAVGRNAAIQAAKTEVVAVTDAGSRVDSNWLKEISRPFEKKDVQVVSGYYAIDPKTRFEAASGYLMNQAATELDNSWFPSSRSIAFRKQVWEKVGGYPEDLTYAGEDTLFDQRIKEAGYEFHFQPSAVVYWRPRPNLRGFYRQYFFYAKGDGQRWLESHGYSRKFILYLFFLTLLIVGIFYHLALLGVILLFLAYLCFRARKTWQRSHNVGYTLLSIPLVAVYDLAAMLGFIRGTFDWLRNPLYRKPHGSAN